MDKRKIDLDVYEKYVDASVALFMEYYCATRSEDMHQQIENIQAEGMEFPDTLDARCRATIKKECATRKRKQCLKSCVKGLRYVASVAIVLLALASVLFVSVEAIRVPIINYYVTHSEKYVEFTARQPDAVSGIENINAEDPLAGLLPIGYTLIALENESPNSIQAIYNNSNSSILFSMYPSNSVLRVDSENAQTVKEIQICGCDGVLIAKNGSTTITWGYEHDSKTFLLASTDLTEAELVNLAEQFMQNIC